jgi:D-alanyl-lipoteichoic acid acyltransferase DltB (MBOAT superfamily)
MNLDSASFQFVLFGLATALLSNFSCSRIWRSCVLMLASLLFLGLLAHSWVVFLPLAGFLLLGYLGLVLLQNGFSKSMVWSILAVIFVYIWLKQYTFIPEAMFLRFSYFTLGLSYIFFRVLHLLIDRADSTNKQPINLAQYMLYTVNFTTLISGPIQLYDDFARDQFAAEPIALGPRVIGVQLERIVIGFFKVNVIALLLHAMHEDAVAQMHIAFPVSLRLFAAFKLILLYPFFIYTNFSGYIDIVIALARLMRIRLPENFDRPFSASSFLDFWSRWHITLSNWLKMYVYNPLLIALMRRVSSVALQTYLGVFCFFVTFFVAGIWHGRTSEFAFFGLLQGSGVAINKFWQLWLTSRMGRKGYKALASNAFYIAFGRGLTFSWFAFTVFWFWSNWGQLGSLLSALGAVKWIGVWTALWLMATVVLAMWEWFYTMLSASNSAIASFLMSRYTRVVFASALALIAFVFTIVLNQPVPPIVYKAF